MKDLNLRSDYPLFDWTTTEDRQKSYNALVNKLNTSNFKISVWNEMVDLLNNALIEVGLSWDSMYCTFLETKLYKILFIFPAPLTATKFNSFRYNIEKVINSTWIWEYDKSYEGYVGRKDFIGASTSNNPDTLYSSTMLELVRKLNLFINILKNEANLLNCINSLKGSMTSKASLSIPTLARAYVNYTGVTTINSNIDIDTPIIVGAKDYEQSSQSSKLALKNASGTFKATATSKTYSNATIVLEELYRNIYSKLLCSTKCNAKLIVAYDEAKIKINFPLELIPKSSLSLADLSKLIVNACVEQTSNSALSSLESFDLDKVEEISKVVAEGVLGYCNKKIINIKSKSNASYLCEIENIRGSSFVTVVVSALNQKSNLSKKHSGNMAATLSCNAFFTLPALCGCLACAFDSVFLECNINSKGSMNKGLSKGVDGKVDSKVKDYGALSKCISGGLSSHTECLDVTTGEVEVLAIRLCRLLCNINMMTNGTLNTGQGISQGSNLNLEQIENARVDIYTYKGAIYTILDLTDLVNATMRSINYGVNYPKIKEVINLSEAGEMIVNEPRTIKTNVDFNQTEDAIIKVLNGNETLMVRTSIKELFNTTLKTLISTNTGALVNNGAFFNAQMSFDSSSWLNPVKTDTDLEIYQTYGAKALNNNLTLE